MLIDTDTQGSASFWAAVRDEREDRRPRVSCVRLHGRSVASQVRDLATRYEDLIVDAGGRDSVELRAAMTVAEVLLIPIQASQFDTWTLEAMDRLLEQVSAFNPELRALVAINRASTNPRVVESDEARELIAEYESLGLASTMLCDRIAYRRSAREGLGVVEFGDDHKASNEIESLYREVYRNE